VRLYLETDPVLPLIEVAQGKEFTIELLSAHTHHFTYGENFGAPDCAVPLERFSYHPTRPPVILDWWRTDAPPTADALTTIANWRQTSKDISWQGQTLTWSKDVQFLRFLSLPRRVQVPIELALSANTADLERLRAAAFSTLEEAAAAFEAVLGDYPRQAGGAFDLAREYLRAETVLAALLDRVGASASARGSTTTAPA
jgi:hypothetical protein